MVLGGSVDQISDFLRKSNDRHQVFMRAEGADFKSLLLASLGEGWRVQLLKFIAGAVTTEEHNQIAHLSDEDFLAVFLSFTPDEEWTNQFILSLNTHKV